jgi:hypothetical protein
MPRLRNAEPMFHTAHRGWTPMDEPSADHDRATCTYCLRDFHEADLAGGACEECREFIINSEGE